MDADNTCIVTLLFVDVARVSSLAKTKQKNINEMFDIKFTCILIIDK